MPPPLRLVGSVAASASRFRDDTMAFISPCCSVPAQSFLMPRAVQDQLMVFGPGRYRSLDVAAYGFPA